MFNIAFISTIYVSTYNLYSLVGTYKKVDRIKLRLRNNDFFMKNVIFCLKSHLKVTATFSQISVMQFIKTPLKCKWRKL